MNEWISTKLQHLNCWDMEKNWLDFDDLDQVFKVTLRLRLVENGLSVPCLLKEWVDFDQTCTAIFLGHASELIRFWWPWPHFQLASVAQLDAPSDWRPGGRGFNPRWGRQHSFVEIDHEIFSTVILSLPLTQEGQLSVSGKRMCTILVNRFED